MAALSLDLTRLSRPHSPTGREQNAGTAPSAHAGLFQAGPPVEWQMGPLFSLETSSAYPAQEQQDGGHALQLFTAASSEEA